jgi:monoamine oxidase
MYLREYASSIGVAPQPQLSQPFSRECQKLVRRRNALKKSRVAVVGGGLAGLMAARWLGQFGFDVTVFEARNQVGGRVLSNSTFSNGRITEEGAELIGSFHTTWLGLAREYGLAVVSRMDPDLYERAGLHMKLRLDTDRDLSKGEICRLGQEMDVVLEKLARAASQIRDPSLPWLDPTLETYDKMSVAEALKGPPYRVDPKTLLWKMLKFKLVNDEVAPLEHMNFLGLLCKVRRGQSGRFCDDDMQGRARLMRYWDELEIFRCADGCQTLAKKIAEEIQSKEFQNKYGAKVKFHPSTAVTHIDLSQTKVPGVVLGSKKVKDQQGEKLAPGPPDITSHDFVILAIPPNRWSTLPITPWDPKIEIGIMGMDDAVKFFSDVKERFWIKAKPPAAPYGGSLKLGQVWEGTDNQTRVVLGKVPNPRGGLLEVKQGIVLSVFAGPILPGPRGAGRAPTQREMEDELERLYPGYSSNLTKTRSNQNKTLFRNWPNEPFIKTGYASPRLGEIFKLVPKLCDPFHDLLFFAGEHTRMDFFGYMEGALRSGEDAAKKLMLQSCGLLQSCTPPKKPAPASPGPRVWTASTALIREKRAF